MSTFQIEIPDDAGVNEFDVKMTIAAKLFEDGKLTSGQAASIVGVSKKTFVEIVGKYGVSIFGYSFEELEEDLKNA